MKRGQLNYFTVGLIIGVVILLIAGGVGLKLYFKYNQLQGDLDEINDKINNLKEGESSYQIFSLENNYYLVGFKGSDFEGKTDQGVDRKIKKPDICGTDLCLCYCRVSWTQGIEENDCVERGKCIQFESSEYNFLCPECGNDLQLCIQGAEGGLIEIFFKKENKQIYISTQEDFVSPLHKQTVESFKDTVSSLNSCSEFSGECLCKLDFSFLPPTDLITIKDKEIIFNYITQTFTEQSPIPFALENSQDTELKLTMVKETSSAPEPGITSSSETAAYSYSLYINDQRVSSNIHKVGDKFYFYNPTQQYNNLLDCSTQQVTI